MTGSELDRQRNGIRLAGTQVTFATEAEARAFAAAQPPGVIGVVPTTVNEPGDPVYDRRAAKLAERTAAADAALIRMRDARRLVRRERTRRVLRFVAAAWMLLCVTATVWFAYGLWQGHYQVRLTVPFCVSAPEPTI